MSITKLTKFSEKVHKTRWDFWQINKTELTILQLSRNFYSLKAVTQRFEAVMQRFASPPLVHIMFSVRAHSLATEKVFIYMNILKSPKDTKTTTFSQVIINFSKTEL